MNLYYANYPKINCREWREKQFGTPLHPARHSVPKAKYPLSPYLAVRYYILMERARSERKWNTENLCKERLERAGIQTNYF